MQTFLKEVLVCYDVKVDKRRTKLFEALKDLGLAHVQDSVFWGWLNPAEEKSLGTLFGSLLDPKTDRAFAVRSHLASGKHMATHGYESSFFETFKPYETL